MRNKRIALSHQMVEALKVLRNRGPRPRVEFDGRTVNALVARDLVTGLYRWRKLKLTTKGYHASYL